MLVPLCSCSWIEIEQGENDNDKTYVEKTHDVINHSSSYTIKNTTLSTYTFDGDGATYVEVYSFINALDGFLDSSSITMTINTYSGNDYLRLSVPYGEYYSIDCVFYWDDDIISVDNTGFFSLITKSSESTDYNSNLALRQTESSGYGSYRAHYYLGNYDMDILFCNDKVLVPFDVMNLLFCSQNYMNVYFNGDDFHIVDTYLSPSDSFYSNVMTSSRNDTTPSSEFREYNYDFMCFAMDTFYGLRDYLNLGSRISSYISNKGYADGMKSKDSLEYTKAYLEFFRKDLDEAHTSIVTSSYYDIDALESIGSTMGISTYNGSFRNKYVEQYTSLSQAASDAYSDGVVPAIRYISDDTAVLHFDSFMVGTSDELRSSTPWLYDTYEFMDHYLGMIVEKGCSNVILDLSTNGGGTIAAMLKALGFLTSDYIPYMVHDMSSNDDVSYYYEVTVDNRAYRNLNYALLTSVCTYSAANLFSATFKNMGLGYVYGRKSGGGMCAVFPMVLADGTTIPMSGPYQLQIKNSLGNFVPVQDGIAVDTSFDSYSYYYDDSYLLNAVKFDL